MSGEGAFPRGTRWPRSDHSGLTDIILREPSAAAPLLDEAVLRQTAERVVAAFAEQLDAGTLKPAQHGALRDLERALVPFNNQSEHVEVKDAASLDVPPPGGPTSALLRPAGDLTDGDDRQRWAVGRPGA